LTLEERMASLRKDIRTTIKSKKKNLCFALRVFSIYFFSLTLLLLFPYTVLSNEFLEGPTPTESPTSISLGWTVLPYVHSEWQFCGNFSTSETEDATKNIFQCVVTLCEGDIMKASLCQYDHPEIRYSGDSYLRLKNDNSTKVAENDDSCFLGSMFTYIVSPGSGCGNYTTDEGCYGSGTCQGTVGVIISRYTEKVDPGQNQALINFYNSTGGENWEWPVGAVPWNLSTNPCYPSTWFGISCDFFPNSSTNMVSSISLRGMNLQGDLSDLQDFRELMSLDLSYNNLFGSFPRFWNFSRLYYVDLSGNGFNEFNSNTLRYLPSLTYLGLNNLNLSTFPALSVSPSELSLSGNNFWTIPHTIQELSSVEYLDLGSNNLQSCSLSATLPNLQEIWLYDNVLTSCHLDNMVVPGLISLDLSSNRLTEFPNLNLSSLQSLYLADNRLRKCDILIPLSLLNYLDLWKNEINSCHLTAEVLPNLVYLFLDSNQMSEFPSLNLSLLSSLEVSQNRLSKCDISIPLSALNYLGLSNNNFNSCYLDGEMVPKLGSLYLDGNQISMFPNFNLSSLYELFLTDNNIQNCSGTIALPRLTTLDLSGNVIDNCYLDEDMLPRLDQLSLTSNRFTTFPQLNCTTLNFLELGSNYIRELPTVVSAVNLIHLGLGANKLDGRVPRLTMFPFLESLDLSHNALTGTVPAFEEVSGLSSLDLSYNHLSGQLPDFGNLSLIIKLDVSSNQLTGNLTNVQKLLKVQELSLSDNQISGVLPEALLQFHDLSAVDVSNNRLHGTLPNVIGPLRYLNLASNYFSGTFPERILHTAFEAINFADNKFTGTIPRMACVKALYLIYFNVSYNFFTGRLDLSFDEYYSALGIFEVSHNRFSGPIEGFLTHMPNLIQLRLSSNHFSGSLSTAISKMMLLKSCYLNQNRFVGNIETVFNVSNQRNLQVIDLSDNKLQGTIPENYIALPHLRVIALSKNCFEGSIPSTVCTATNLTVLAMDGLGNAESCQRKLFPKTVIDSYTLVNPIEGTFPYCLLELPSITVIHLSGNGLTGTIPEQVALSENLTELSISYNRIRGHIPRSFFMHRWVSMDISFNKFEGQLENFNFPSANATTSYSLTENRLSGMIPDTFNSISNLNLLEGNMFDCAVRNGMNVLPKNDPGAHSYSCGSQNVNNSLIIWVTISCWVVMLRAFFAFKNRKSQSATGFALPNFRRSLRDLHVNITDYYEVFTMWWGKTTSDAYFQKLLAEGKRYEAMGILNTRKGLQFLRKMSTVLAVLVAVVFLPTYSTFGRYRTHENSYIWTVSLAFLSGQFPAILVFLLLFLLFFVPLWIFLKFTDFQMVNLKKFAKELMSVHVLKRSWKSFLARITTIFINNSVVFVVNITYVYYLGSGLKTSGRAGLQLAMAFFKLGWGVTFIKRIFLVILKHFDESAAYDENNYGKVQLLSILNIFNIVLVPVISTAMFDSNCFKFIFFSPEPVTVAYSMDFNCLVAVSKSNNTYSCLDITERNSITYAPPFIYNYQCSSAILTEFITIFVYKYTVSMLFMIVGSVALILLMKYRFASEVLTAIFIPKQIHFSILKMERERKLWRPFERVEKYIVHYFGFLFAEDQHSLKCFDADIITIGFIGDLAVLCTFGLVFPPLALIVAVSIISQTVFHQFLIGRLICELEQAMEEEEEKEERDDYQRWSLPEEYFKILCKESQYIWEYVKPSIKYLAFFSSIFVSFFLFDILGDDVGLLKSIWIIPITSIFPVILVIVEPLMKLVFVRCLSNSKWLEKLQGPFVRGFSMLLVETSGKSRQYSYVSNNKNGEEAELDWNLEKQNDMEAAAAEDDDQVPRCPPLSLSSRKYQDVELCVPMTPVGKKPTASFKGSRKIIPVNEDDAVQIDGGNELDVAANFVYPQTEEPRDLQS
jgi:Leucine-rich repeat (LRR) protein